MNKIFKLAFVLCAVFTCCACSDDDEDMNKDSLRPISPITYLKVTATDNADEFFVECRKPVYTDVKTIEISYNAIDDERPAGRSSDEKPNVKSGTVEIDANAYPYDVEYYLTVPGYATYDISITLIDSKGNRSEARSTTAESLYVEAANLNLFDCAHELMTTVKDLYSDKTGANRWQYIYRNNDSWQGDASVQQQGSCLAAFIATRAASAGTDKAGIYAQMDNEMFESIQKFLIENNGTTAYAQYPEVGKDRCYDDNALIGINMMEWYAATQNARYLEQAKATWEYVASGWDEVCSGGIYLKEKTGPTDTKHTSSTATAAVLSCKLYQVTNDQKYLDFALQCYDWLIINMRDITDYLFYDYLTPDQTYPERPAGVETKKWSLNSGQVMQAACLLYTITQQENYLSDARKIAESCHKVNFEECKSKVLHKTFNILKWNDREHAWLNTVMIRGFFELYSIDRDPKYLNDVRDTMLHAWSGNAHNENGLINDWNLRADEPSGQNEWEFIRECAFTELLGRLALWQN